MKELKLLLLEKGDSQKNLIDKANFNFSEIISFEGGPYGKIGPEGKAGAPGPKGPTGSFGPQGKRGNSWSVSIDPPSNPSDGDYWMNPINNNEIRIYNSNSENWDFYSLNINGLDLFREFGPLQTGSGPSSKRGYFISLPFPDLSTFVLSDSYLSDGSSTANPQYTKMVISTNSQIAGRRLMEFTKSPYHGTSFNQETPYFGWSTGPTSSEGNYALNLISPKSLDFNLGGDLNFKSLSGSIIMSSPSFPYGLNKYINGFYSSSSGLGNLNINVSSGSDALLFSGKNISYPNPVLGTINTTTNLHIRTNGTTGSQPSLNIKSGNDIIGNLYYKMDEVYPSTRSGSTLFKATNSSTSILEISGRGEFKIDKAIYPLHPLENSAITSGITGIGISLFSPAISPYPGGTGFNACRGVDYYIGGDSFTEYIPLINVNGNSNGWATLIEQDEFINFRIHSDPNKGFVGVFIDTPAGVTGSFFSPFPSRYETIEFTIINISKTSTGTSPTDRWFKVLYQGYGGNTSSPICGELYTDGSTP